VVHVEVGSPAGPHADSISCMLAILVDNSVQHLGAADKLPSGAAITLAGDGARMQVPGMQRSTWRALWQRDNAEWEEDQLTTFAREVPSCRH
jgi:hypothetical protein